MIRLILGFLLLFAQIPFVSAQPFRSSDIQVLAIIGASVVPMDTERVLKDQTIIVRDGLIAEIGPARSIRIPPSAKRIDARGKFVMPGLIDAHTHLYSRTELPLYITSGVTTVFDMNGRPPQLLWKKQAAESQLMAPNILSCGPNFNRIRTPAEAVAEVERQFKAGYDGVKIYYQISKDEVQAIAAAAHERNMIVVGHVARRAGFESTLKAGQSIAHAEEYLYSFFNRSTDPNRVDIDLDESRIAEAVKQTRSSGISVVPTLSTYHGIVKQVTDLETFLKLPEFRYLSPYQRALLQPDQNRYKTNSSPTDISSKTRNFEFQKKLVKALYDAGVPIVAGTDSVGAGTVAGFSIHDELRTFTSIGFSNYAALRTATASAAEFLKSSDKFGTVAVGKRADLLLLKGDPLADLANVQRQEAVIIRGKYLHAAELKTSLDAVPHAYQKEFDMVTERMQKDPAAAAGYVDDNDPFGQLGAAVIEDIIVRSGMEKLKPALASVRQTAPGSVLVRENTLNRLGYKLLRGNKTALAIGIFHTIVEFYPTSANAYDSLAEAHSANGDKGRAIQFYTKSLELNPQNETAKENLRKLRQ